MLELTAAPFKSKIARLLVCRSSGEHITMFPGRSLSWMTRSVPVMKRTISIEFDDSIVHRCFGAT